ncbi:MAG: putative metal-binding motif-containing protein, partial [Deltaproteobacteria bacterium]|nr:putative metal-binding motif-containing protein [Kofleriaceae bacterium]
LTPPRFGRVRAVGRVLAAGGALVTLMACYGMVARPGSPYDASCQSDNDRDTVCAPRDCDDARADVFPGAADPDEDGVDQNCDGVDGWRDPAEVAVDPPAPQVVDPPSEPAPPSP